MAKTYSKKELTELFNKIRDRSFSDYCSKSELKFGNREERGYSSPFNGNVFVNLDLINKCDMNRNAMTGLLAHELGHQISYKSRNIFSRFLFLWNYYYSIDKRFAVEKEADFITIDRGYAKELLIERKSQQAAYINNPKRLAIVKKAYLTHKELKRYIKERKLKTQSS